MPEDQKVFRHHSMALERLGVSLFGDKYHKAIDRWDIAFWKSLYVSTFEVLRASVFSSIGSVDKQHRQDIEHELDHALQMLKVAKAKDEINAATIASLFRLVFLLLGRLPYHTKGKRRNLGTFRTLTYSQTEEQLSWMLQGHIQRNAENFGFGDFFDADFAFHQWAREKKRTTSDRSAYVEWVRESFPETYAEFR